MYFIGVDLGGTNIKMGIVKRDGEIIAKSSIPTRVSLGARVVAEDIGHGIVALLEGNNIALDDIVAVGVGCPGAIDSKHGIVTYSNNLDWHEVPLAKWIYEFIPKTIRISNDANVAALGESMFGSAKHHDSSVLLTLGTGVGGGIVIDNKLFEGNESKGAELGHMVICMNGEPCTCGRLGCLEAYASATALIRDTKRAMDNDKNSMMWKYCDNDIDNVSGKTSFECAKLGDITAQKVVDNYIFYLGEGITNIVNILRPQAIILGGGVCAQGDNLIIPLIKHVKTHQYGGLNSAHVDIIIASLGNDAGIVGAASLVM